MSIIRNNLKFMWQEWWLYIFQLYMYIRDQYLYEIQEIDLNYAKLTCIYSTSQEIYAWFILICPGFLNSLLPGQNGHHFADDIFTCILMNEKFCILIRISLKFVPKGPIDDKSAVVQVMAWRQTGDSQYLNQCWPSSKMQICGTRGR